jgi:alpha-galactosidase
MDPLDILQVRFHFGGQFDYDGFAVNYVGGSVGMYFIVRDKLSLSELRGHLSHHTTISVEDHVDFHWLYPGFLVKKLAMV